MQDSRNEHLRLWVVALCEPLLPIKARLAADEGAENVAASSSWWFRVWSAGVISDIMLTLDPDDPWMRLSVDENGTVRTPDGEPFGSWKNSADILHVPSPTYFDPREDLGLAALAYGIHERAALLLAQARGGLDAMLDILRGTSDDELFEVASEALRWAIHRRRIFTGLDDAYAPVTAKNWIPRADKIVAGQPWGQSGAARLRASAAIPPGTIKQYLGD